MVNGTLAHAENVQVKASCGSTPSGVQKSARRGMFSRLGAHVARTMERRAARKAQRRERRTVEEGIGGLLGGKKGGVEGFVATYDALKPEGRAKALDRLVGHFIAITEVDGITGANGVENAAAAARIATVFEHFGRHSKTIYRDDEGPLFDPITERFTERLLEITDARLVSNSYITGEFYRWRRHYTPYRPPAEAPAEVYDYEASTLGGKAWYLVKLAGSNAKKWLAAQTPAISGFLNRWVAEPLREGIVEPVRNGAMKLIWESHGDSWSYDAVKNSALGTVALACAKARWIVMRGSEGHEKMLQDYIQSTVLGDEKLRDWAFETAAAEGCMETLMKCATSEKYAPRLAETPAGRETLAAAIRDAAVLDRETIYAAVSGAGRTSRLKLLGMLAKWAGDPEKSTYAMGIAAQAEILSDGERSALVGIALGSENYAAVEEALARESLKGFATERLLRLGEEAKNWILVLSSEEIGPGMQLDRAQQVILGDILESGRDGIDRITYSVHRTGGMDSHLHRNIAALGEGSARDLITEWLGSEGTKPYAFQVAAMMEETSAELQETVRDMITMGRSEEIREMAEMAYGAMLENEKAFRLKVLERAMESLHAKIQAQAASRPAWSRWVRVEHTEETETLKMTLMGRVGFTYVPRRFHGEQDILEVESAGQEIPAREQLVENYPGDRPWLEFAGQEAEEGKAEARFAGARERMLAGIAGALNGGPGAPNWIVDIDPKGNRVLRRREEGIQPDWKELRDGALDSLAGEFGLGMAESMRNWTVEMTPDGRWVLEQREGVQPDWKELREWALGASGDGTRQGLMNWSLRSVGGEGYDPESERQAQELEGMARNRAEVRRKILNAVGEELAVAPENGADGSIHERWERLKNRASGAAYVAMEGLREEPAMGWKPPVERAAQGEESEMPEGTPDEPEDAETLFQRRKAEIKARIDEEGELDVRDGVFHGWDAGERIHVPDQEKEWQREEGLRRMREEAEEKETGQEAKPAGKKARITAWLEGSDGKRTPLAVLEEGKPPYGAENTPGRREKEEHAIYHMINSYLLPGFAQAIGNNVRFGETGNGIPLVAHIKSGEGMIEFKTEATIKVEKKGQAAEEGAGSGIADAQGQQEPAQGQEGGDAGEGRRRHRKGTEGRGPRKANRGAHPRARPRKEIACMCRVTVCAAGEAAPKGDGTKRE